MASAPKIIIITQEHRGHGVTTAAYFLGQALAQRGIPVLLADMTERTGRLPQLNRHFPTRNLVLWSPPASGQRDLPALLMKARSEVAGRATCLLLDADLAMLDTLQTADDDLRLVDFVVLATEHTIEATKGAERVANRYPALRDRHKFGLAFARIPGTDTAAIPDMTEDELPILGYWPADYRLATSDDVASAIVPEPHQPYLDAINALAIRLARQTPLLRLTHGV
jgi:hypothetical protein